MKYIDAERLKAEIERFSATEYGGNTLGDDVATGALDYVLEEIIPSLQQKTEEEQRKRNDEMRKTSIEYSDSVIKHIEAKRALPSFKGQLLHDFKNELNTMEQILNIRMWSEIQYAIFEKVALNFAAWGGYHFHPGKPQTEDSLQQEQNAKSYCREHYQEYEDTCGKCFFEWSCPMIKQQEQPEVDLEKEEFVGVAESPLKTFPRVNDFECGGSYRH